MINQLSPEICPKTFSKDEMNIPYNTVNSCLANLILQMV